MVQRRGKKWRLQYWDVTGKKKSKTFDKKADADAFLEKNRRTRQLFRAGLQAPAEEILFYDAVIKFLSKRDKSVTVSTVRQDASRFRNYWMEEFGKRPVSSISTAEILERLDYIQFTKGHTPADRNRHRALLHTFFQDLLMRDKILFNPVSKIPLVDESKKKRSSGVLNDRDAETYLKAMYQEGQHYGMLADLMIWTGGRIMAAAALQYRDIDFENGVIRIRRLFERASQTIQERTKGGGEGGAELVPLFPILKDKVLAHRETSQHTRPSDFIACRKDGRVIPYESFLTAHDRVIKKTGIERFTPHAFRKYFATSAKKAGYTRAEIREMLGHSSEAVTGRYDLEDIEHLVEKGKRLRFGQSQGVVSIKRGGK